MDIKTVASSAEKAVEGFMKIEPIVMTVSNFVPGAAPVMALVHPAVVAAAPFIEQALLNIAAGNNANAFTSFIELLQHLVPGQPNSPILAPQPNTASASAQGSG